MQKVMALAEAVSRYVRDGMVIAMGTGLESCIPFAAGHEIIRQRRRDLVLVGPISDILFDQLIGAGCVSKVIAAWVGNVGAGIAYNFRRAVEEGIPRPLAVEDHSNLTVALAVSAAAMGVPYLPARTALGTDIVRDHERMREVTCPFTGDRLLAVGALRPDITILHAQRCDRHGNAHLWGNLGISLEAARAAETVLLTCEELVDDAVITSDPNRTLVPGFLVSAVAEVRDARAGGLPGLARPDGARHARTRGVPEPPGRGPGGTASPPHPAAGRPGELRFLRTAASCGRARSPGAR
ncbi:MAG: CoA transferase subunit A [Bacillati bacterium ANGP1]|uniref:CoA transferase subunit A n=1 Tax=Candidatus Segetimicrobium genomatis TaxID=2569760 RepID=A0A537JIY5_9BACT|nr:MAG: CoA transferase subunit A [Terrabacteria group bacterium ANGP1]